MEIEKLTEEEIVAKDFKPITTDTGMYYTHNIGDSSFVAIDDRSKVRDIWGYSDGKRMRQNEAKELVNMIFSKDEKGETFISKRMKIAWGEIAPEFLQMQQEKAQDELLILSTQDDHVGIANTKGAHYNVLIEGNDLVGCDCDDWYYRGSSINPCKHMVRAQMAIGPEKLVEGELKGEQGSMPAPALISSNQGVAESIAKYTEILAQVTVAVKAEERIPDREKGYAVKFVYYSVIDDLQNRGASKEE